VKGLLFLALVGLVVWFWQSRKAARPSEKAAKPPDAVQDMVRCSHCGLHLPAADAVQGSHGIYCSVEHMNQPEG